MSFIATSMWPFAELKHSCFNYSTDTYKDYSLIAVSLPESPWALLPLKSDFLLNTRTQLVFGGPNYDKRMFLENIFRPFPGLSEVWALYNTVI